MDKLLIVSVLIGILILVFRLVKRNAVLSEEIAKNSKDEISIILSLTSVATIHLGSISDTEFVKKFGVTSEKYRNDLIKLISLFGTDTYISLASIKNYENTWYKVSLKWFELNNGDEFSSNLFKPFKSISLVCKDVSIKDIALDSTAKSWINDLFQRSKQYDLCESIILKEVESRKKFINDTVRFFKLNLKTEKGRNKLQELLDQRDQIQDEIRRSVYD